MLDELRSPSDHGDVADEHAGLGAAGSQAAAGKVTSKVLVLNGEADPFIKPESVDAFKKEMAAASEISPANTTPAMISASLLTLPLPTQPSACRHSRCVASPVPPP